MGFQGRKRGLLAAACFALSFFCAVGITSAASKGSESTNDLPWLVGTGIYDVTGPAAESTNLSENFFRTRRNELSLFWLFPPLRSIFPP
jgi:hypothetical protein